MLNQIPYYDSGHRLIAMVSRVTAERYVAQGTATAVRASNGMIRRLYRRSMERVFGSAHDAVACIHGASQTTRRLCYGDDDFKAQPLIREHRRPDGGWPGARRDGDEPHEQEGRSG